ncbi:hypothetical protein TcWFU_001515 [Taenia crassiceps]|uniref:Uncharacterized protein n=1 Tax=Taenia crassiceps TaxID=6207 RepID=A0ABR4Q152_9CEST
MGKLGMPFLVTLTLALLLTTRGGYCTRLQNAPPVMLTTAGLLASSPSQPPPDTYDFAPSIDDYWDEVHPPVLRKRPWALPDPLHCCLLRLSCCRRRGSSNYS